MMSIRERWKDDGNFLESTPLDPVTGMPISTPSKPLSQEELDRKIAIFEAWEAHDKTGDRTRLVELGLLPEESGTG